MTQETSHTPAMLFDFEGTLIDSVYQHVLAWYEALEELGLAPACGASIGPSA
jgi:beta-phosphoglucomutase-like phosphatase (HAD superfamily)